MESNHATQQIKRGNMRRIKQRTIIGRPLAARLFVCLAAVLSLYLIPLSA